MQRPAKSRAAEYVPVVGTEAAMAFAANIHRSRSFLRTFDGPKGRGRGRPTDDEKELLRAAVVFSVAALDAYLHDLVLEIIPKRGVQSDSLRDALKAIAKEDPSLSLRVALAKGDEARRAEFRTALDSWLSAKSFQGPEAVLRALGLIGCPLTTADIETRLCRPWTERLGHFTQMRHQMVHRGQSPYIRRHDAGESVDLVAGLVEVIDFVAAGNEQSTPGGARKRRVDSKT
jgi:hypothetical protein